MLLLHLVGIHCWWLSRQVCIRECALKRELDGSVDRAGISSPTCPKAASQWSSARLFAVWNNAVILNKDMQLFSMRNINAMTWRRDPFLRFIHLLGRLTHPPPNTKDNFVMYQRLSYSGTSFTRCAFRWIPFGLESIRSSKEITLIPSRMQWFHVWTKPSTRCQVPWTMCCHTRRSKKAKLNLNFDRSWYKCYSLPQEIVTKSCATTFAIFTSFALNISGRWPSAICHVWFWSHCAGQIFGVEAREWSTFTTWTNRWHNASPANIE